MHKNIFLVAFLALLSSCGSITRGTEESVTITSEPADAKISTSTGQHCPSSPCTLTIKRKTEFTAYAEKPGYEKGSVEIKTKVSGGGAAGVAGNILVGGVIGIGVDTATGAALDHYPNPAHIILTPSHKEAPAKPAGKKPSRKSTPTS